MPKGFEECIRKGGKVRTKKLGGGRYMYICFLDGKSYAGEVHESSDTAEAAKKHMKRST